MAPDFVPGMWHTVRLEATTLVPLEDPAGHGNWHPSGPMFIVIVRLIRIWSIDATRQVYMLRRRNLPMASALTHGWIVDENDRGRAMDTDVDFRFL